MMNFFPGALVALAVACSCAAHAAEGAPTPAKEVKDVRMVILHRPGPAWVAGKSVFEQTGIGAHVQHYRQLLQQGKLAQGGPFLDGSGGMMIARRGANEAEMKAFAAADPAVQSGLLTFEVKQWLIGMQDGA
ncbi:YciI family protein [Massilia sp. W12]|uniref:YciI family protein n=1 Tax=Massilia sp. W12 TaxID=3126507 RepID=UPI0030CACFED